MSQSPQSYDTSSVDWTKVLEPSQRMKDERAVRNAVTEDLLNMTEAVRLGKRPEEVWETLNLSRATGLPFSTVEDDKDTALALSYKRALRGDIEGLRTVIDSSPSMVEFVRTRPAAEAAAMATDKQLWNMEATQRGLFADIAHSWEMGDLGQERMRLLYRDWSGAATEEDQTRLRYLDERLALERQQREGESTVDWILRNSVELLPQFRDMAGTMAWRGAEGLVYGAGTGAALGALGGATAGSILPVAGTAAGGGAGALGGAVAGGLAGLKVGASAGALEHGYEIGVSEIWGSIRDMKDAHGNAIDPTIARIIAGIGGVPMAALDFVSMKKAAELVPGLDKFLNKATAEATIQFLRGNPGVMTAVARAGGRAFVALGTETATEGLQEGVVIASEEFAKNTGHMDIASITGGEAIARMAEAGKEAFAAVLPLAVGGGAIRTYANRRIQAAQTNARALDQLHKQATESETVRNAPGLAEEVQKHLGENGGARELYIRPEAFQRVFFQTEEGIAAAAEMGVTPETLAESLALDADIVVPMDKAVSHILGNERAYNEISPDMRLAPDIMTAREAEAYSAAGEDGSSAPADREAFDFMDSVFSGLDEEIATNERRDALAAPYVRQLMDAGYSERQAQHLMAPFVANAEVMAPLFSQTPEEYLTGRLAGFQLTTPEMMNMAGAQLDEKAARQLGRAPLSERDPLLALVRGRLDGADIKNYDSQGYKELAGKYGRGLFRGKAKGGLPLDLLADEAVREGLLPEGSGANELLAALQDRRQTFFQSASSVVGSITPEMAESLPLGKAGDIVLLPDELRHEERHGEQIRGLGYADAREFVNFVLSHVDAIYQGNDRRAFSLVTRQSTPNGQVIAKLDFREEGDGYRVVTANPVREGYFKNKAPLWERAQTNLFQSGESDAVSTSGYANPQQFGNPGASTWSTSGDTGQSGARLDFTTFNSGVNSNTRGAISLLDNGRALVSLFRGKKNLSTVIHEGGHFFLENLREAARLANAPEWVGEAMAALQKEYDFTGNDIPTQAHERFAREFEAYARSGKAPSARLEAAFRQFSNWLVRLYRSVRALVGADDIAPEVRNVFDRLLATEEEIESARRRGASAVSLSDLEAGGLQVAPELRDRYARAVATAQSKAEAAIAARRLVEQRRMEKTFRAEAEERIAQDPFYRAEAGVRERGGINWDSVLAFIDEDLAEDLRRKWAAPPAKGFFKDNGALDFMDAAADFNLDTPQNLAGLLLSMPTRKEAVAAEVQKSLAEWNQVFDSGMEYSNAMDEALAMEIEALTGEKPLSGARFRAELERRMGVKKSSAVDAEYRALKESLRKQESVMREVMREVRRETQTALRQTEQQAQAKGVLAGEMHEGAKRARERRAWQERMAELKSRERAKRAALAAAYRARMERDKLTRQIRKEAGSKNVNDAFRQQILALVAHWRKLGTDAMRPRDIENTPSLADFVTQHESLFGEEQSVFPDWLLAEGNQVGEKSAGDLTLEHVRDLNRAVRILAHQGRNYDRLLSFGKEARMTEAAGEMVASMNKLAGTLYLSEQERAAFQGKVRGLLRGTASEVTAMRYLFDAMDGYVNKGGKNTDTGASHKYIVSGLQEAMGREQGMMREYNTKLVSALTKLARPDMRKSFVIEGVPLADDVAREWGGMFTREKVIAVALNMGNKGNLRALMRGFGWSDADLRNIVSRLTTAELQAVQEIWDIINELYPVLNETHQQLHGVPLAKVEAQEITLQASDGVVALRGGYFPLMFDHALSRKAEEHQSVDELINRNESILRTPNPKSGMTNERKGGTLPPRLSLSVVRQHVTDTIHYATHAPVLRDVYRITQLPEYRNAFIRAAGLEAYNELTPWLRNIARPEGEHVTKIDRMVEWLSKRGTLFVLAVNMKSAFLQLSSIGNSIVEIGGAQFVKGVFQMMSRPHSTFQEVKAKSAYMENRGRMLDASLREWLDRFSLDGAAGVAFAGRRFTLEQVHNAQFAFIQGLDAVVAYPTWVGAYDAAVASGMTEAESISRADAAVIRAQGSGGAMDVARVLRRRGFIKLFTPFMSFALNDFNRKKYFVGGFREYIRGGNSQIDFKTFAQHFALEWVVPVVFSTMMLSLGRDGELPDTEDYVWEAAGFLTMGLLVVRDAARFAEGQFTGKGFGSRMGGSVAFAGLESAVKAVSLGSKYMFEDNEKARDRAIRELINTMGFVFGIGTPQLWRTMDGAEAYFVDGQGGPLAPFLGKPKKD